MNARSGAAGRSPQNIPKRIAPTKMIAAKTASTFSFTAKSTLQASLNADVDPKAIRLLDRPESGNHAALRKPGTP